MTFPTTSTPEQNVTQGEETRKDRRRRLRKIAQQKRRAKMSEEAKEEKKRKDREQKRRKKQDEQGMTGTTNAGVSLPTKRIHSTSIANASAEENPQSHWRATTERRFIATETEVQASLVPVPTENGEFRSQLPSLANAQQQHLLPLLGERVSSLPAPPLETVLVVSSPSFSGRKTSSTRSITSPLDVFASAPEMPVSVAPGNSVVLFPPPLAREEHAMARIQVAAGTLRSDLFNDNLCSILLENDLALSAAFDHLTSLVMRISWIKRRCMKKQFKNLLRDFDITIAVVEKRGGDKDENWEDLEALKLVKGALRASSFALSKDHSELAFQLTGRLLNHSEANGKIRNFLDDVRDSQVEPWLCPLSQCLESPNSSMQGMLHTHSNLDYDSEVRSVACVGHGNNVIIVYCTSLGKGYIWNGSELHCFGGTNGDAVKFVDVGSIAAAVVTESSGQQNIHVHDIESGKLMGVCARPDEMICSVAVAKRANVMVAYSRGKCIRVWSVKNAKCVGVLREDSHSVTSLAVTDDGRVAVSGSSDWTVRVWDVESEQCMSVLQHCARVDCVKIARGGKLVVSQTWDLVIHLWNATSGICEMVLECYGDEYLEAISDDGNIVVTSELRESEDLTQIINVHNTRNGLLKKKKQEYICSAMAFVDDGSLAVLGSFLTIRMWNLDSMEHVWSRRYRVECVANDGDIAISGGSDGTIRVWDMVSGLCTKILEGHSGKVMSVALSGDSKVAVSGSWDNTARIWNVTLGMCRKTLKGHEGAVRSVALTRRGDVVVSGSNDKTVRV